MSTSGTSGVTQPQRSTSSGPQSTGIPLPPQHSGSVPPTPAPQTGPASQQNLNQIVIEYLNKKGYVRTEATLRQESANVDGQGRVVTKRIEDKGGQKYFFAFPLIQHWIEDNLEIYKTELRRLLWPIFVYSYLSLVNDYFPELSKKFFDDFSKPFVREHEEDLKTLEFVRHHDFIQENATAKAYWNNKYRLTLTTAAFYSLVQFLENRDRDGGSVLNSLIQERIHLVTVDRASAGNERSLAAMLARADGENDIPDEDEGIPGHHPGVANTDPKAPPILTRLNLGPLPMDAEMSTDVRDELDEEDEKNPPAAGQNSLIEEFDQQIKREPSEDAPNRENVPLPKPLARDVAIEVQRIKENRDRFKILDTRSNGIGAGISVTMFTFHNTFDSINCIDFSGDNTLVAAGTAESYIRVWSLEGKALSSILPEANQQPSSSRRLIGHSGPVYAVSFSPSAANEDPANGTSTSSRCLLSCSADKTVRLWSIDAWTCLVVYKGHDHPVWDVTWGPFGHYFLTGSHDNTARLWSTDHIAPLRIFAGHDKDVDCVAFHPNNAYCFTGSCDTTVRMWDVSRGSAVRLFTGHTANVTAIACAPSGKTLASADDSGAIILWDLATGRRVKRMRGHGRGGIWSLSWSVESTVLVSAGADNTVRVWDVLQQTEGPGAGRPAGDGGTGPKIDGTAPPSGVSGVVAGKKGKGREVGVSGDQISAFPTKKSPVYKVRFTNMNLVLAGGAYMP